MTTLIEALANGQGIERPFHCTEHDDHSASASVNVQKLMWFCFACGASGQVDSKRVPKVDELKAMMEPEVQPRIYPDAWLDLYADPGYWATRFEPWVCWQLGLGEDPFTGDGVFPVHTAGGKLAGVGKRKLDPGDGPRYVYPNGWSAASSLFGFAGKYPSVTVLTLVEGAADAAACWEIGAPAVAVYGSGLHYPQYELVARYNPRVVMVGFDADFAGDKAAERAVEGLFKLYTVQRVNWEFQGTKDPAELDLFTRGRLIDEAVSRSGYTGNMSAYRSENMERIKASYNQYLEREMR